MKQVVICIIVCLYTINILTAQAANALYLEVGGPGIFSLNYDRRFIASDDGPGIRLGIGPAVEISRYIASHSIPFSLRMPVGVNYLLGKNGNYFELEMGYSFSFNKNPINNIYTESFGYIHIGYRYAPKYKNFIFRIGIIPVIKSWVIFPLWGGISFGYKF